ncbi:MAG: glutamine amidotransferase [Castellaniella sp.]|uniref:glutamine amidotransferase n=1 Tax=Castellaniella sp. TaxID=1955812 RepID=UPI003A85C6AE
MKKPVVLVVRHVAYEDLGILAPLLTQRGYDLQYVEAGVDRLHAGSLLAADLVVILGGPIGVYETDRYPFLSDEQQAIAARLGQDKPTLGICLGAQLMARALGAEVSATGRVEIGYAPLRLTRQGEASALRTVAGVPVLHWHGDQFAIPDGASRLAETPGFPNQAFSFGPRILGLQFHLEADHAQIERWLIGHAHELSARGVSLDAIRRDAVRYGPDLARCAGSVLTDWLDALAH